MHEFPVVDILLSTYNGEKYLEELITSLVNQSWTHWQLRVRDDGSTDRTPEMIKECAEKFPGRIFLLEDGKSRLGPTLSFASLLENCRNNYIMLCDQDDVWLQNKVEMTLDAMLRLEDQYPGKPLMVFTDLIEVDEKLRVLSGSFMKSQRLFPSVVHDPARLAALNVVAGCTTMINRPALGAILPIRSRFVTHDQWMAVAVARHGKISYLNVPTILYRQHAANVLGSKKVGVRYFSEKLSRPLKQFRIYSDLIRGNSFRINPFKFLFYKSFYTIKRLLY